MQRDTRISISEVEEMELLDLVDNNGSHAFCC